MTRSTRRPRSFSATRSGSVRTPPVPAVQLEGVAEELQLRDVSVSASYFRTFGMRIEQGRDFAGNDRDGVVVNRALATRYSPNQNVVGKRMRAGTSGRWRTVIGVVNDTRHYSVLETAVPMVYRPFAESPETRAQLVILSSTPTSSLLPAIRPKVRDLDISTSPP